MPRNSARRLRMGFDISWTETEGVGDADLWQPAGSTAAYRTVAPWLLAHRPQAPGRLAASRTGRSGGPDGGRGRRGGYTGITLRVGVFGRHATEKTAATERGAVSKGDGEDVGASGGGVAQEGQLFLNDRDLDELAALSMSSRLSSPRTTGTTMTSASSISSRFQKPLHDRAGAEDRRCVDLPALDAPRRWNRRWRRLPVGRPPSSSRKTISGSSTTLAIWWVCFHRAGSLRPSTTSRWCGRR